MIRVSKFLCVTVSATALVLAGGYTASMAQSAGGGGSAAGTPATRPSAMPADQLLNQMLRPKDAAARPLLPQPESDPRDVTSGRGATGPGAPSMPLLREGTFVVDRTGRLSRSGGDVGSFAGHEFIFEADGRTLRDPPMVVLPNLALQRMEDANKGSNRDLRFRVTGVVTEYRGRNAILIEKVVVIPDVVQQN